MLPAESSGYFKISLMLFQVQLVQHLFQLCVGEALNQQLLRVAVQLNENLCGLFFGQQPEQKGKAFLVQFLAQARNVLRFHR